MRGSLPVNKVQQIAKLVKVNTLLGEHLGSEDLSVFLYSQIKMQRCRNVVELGTGLGVSAFWMAQAVHENGQGQVSTLDDGRAFVPEGSERAQALITQAEKQLGLSLPRSRGAQRHLDYLKAMSAHLGLSRCLKLCRGSISLNGAHFGAGRRYPFLRKPIDLLFSDFAHQPKDILKILATFLPRMSDWSSILIDCASTKLASFLMLERTVEQLNRGKVARSILSECRTVPFAKELLHRVQHQRFTLVHLVEEKDRVQNSTAWLKIEPLDIVSYPPRLLRG